MGSGVRGVEKLGTMCVHQTLEKLDLERESRNQEVAVKGRSCCRRTRGACLRKEETRVKGREDTTEGAKFLSSWRDESRAQVERLFSIRLGRKKQKRCLSGWGGEFGAGKMSLELEGKCRDGGGGVRASSSCGSGTVDWRREQWGCLAVLRDVPRLRSWI